MERKIKVGAVSYLNTKPLIFGIERGIMSSEVELIFDYPARIAQKLADDIIDIGLIPIAAMKDIKESYLLPDYCIGCDGEVASVCLFSEVPLDEIQTITLDYQSRTSVELLKILMRDYWNIHPAMKTSTPRNRGQISGTTAGLVIGDKALEQRGNSSYTYDLGYEWKKFTGLPFVFAGWVSNKRLDEEFISAFKEANKWGLKHLDEVIMCKSFRNKHHLFIR